MFRTMVIDSFAVCAVAPSRCNHTLEQFILLRRSSEYYSFKRCQVPVGHPVSLGLPSGLFPSGFPTKTLYKPLLSPILAICTSHLIPLDMITRTIFGHLLNSMRKSFCALFKQREVKVDMRDKYGLRVDIPHATCCSDLGLDNALPVATVIL